jgi:hypothetical protein
MRTSRFIKTFAATIAALMMVGCASATAPQASGPSPSGSVAPDSDATFAFSQCMRDNGVADFPNPQESGEIYWSKGEFDPDSPAFKAAEEACESLLPGSPGDSEDNQWEKVVPGGDCECADGSEFAFWERRADPAKIVFFLDGGGSCFDAETCAFTGLGTGGEANYDWSIFGEDPAREDGIFNLARADDPFGSYSFIYVPVCTGDMHLGDVTREYSPQLTVEHNGYVNGTAALGYLAENYPDATQVVVVGKTGGSVAAPIYGGLAADLLPDAHVIVFGGQSGHYPDDPDLNAEILGEAWGAYDNMPDWKVNEGLTARDWGPPRFWIQAGLHDPEIVLARFDYAYDREAAETYESLGLDPSELLAVIDANEAAIEHAGVVQQSYTAPGYGHGIFEWQVFYELEVNGVRLVDWVAALIAGDPVDDVHCDECETK